MILKKILYLLLIILFSTNLFSQKKYVRKWEKLPPNWKFALFNDSTKIVNTEILKSIFENDTLYLQNSNIDDLKYLNLFRRLVYVNLAGNNISDFPDKVSAYKYNYINLENNNISYSKICEFKYNYKRGETFYSPDFYEIKIIASSKPNNIKVEKRHFDWWNKLEENWKTLLEENANFYIQNYNDITHEELKKILNIEIFTCNNQNINNLIPLKELKNLVIIDCSKNSIIDLKPLSELSNLGIINCSNNLISDLEPLKNLINIEILNFSNNKISDLTPIQYLKKIQFLNCSSNQITDLQYITNFQNLNTLLMAYNPILDLDVLNNSKNLDNLIVSNLKNSTINKLSNKNLNKTNLDNGKSALITTICFGIILTFNFFIKF